MHHGGELEVVHRAHAAQRRQEREVVVRLERLTRLHLEIRTLQDETLLQLAQERVMLLLEERAAQEHHARRHESDEVQHELEPQAAERFHRAPRGSCTRRNLALAWSK